MTKGIVMKRRQKRYESQQEILDAIDCEKVKVEELKARAVHQQWLVDNCEAEQKRSNVGCYDHDHQGNADMCWRSIERIEKNKLVKLKNALAAFRTQPMPFCEDNGVVLEPLK